MCKNNTFTIPFCLPSYQFNMLHNHQWDNNRYESENCFVLNLLHKQNQKKCMYFSEPTLARFGLLGAFVTFQVNCYLFWFAHIQECKLPEHLRYIFCHFHQVGFTLISFLLYYHSFHHCYFKWIVSMTNHDSPTIQNF